MGVIKIQDAKSIAIVKPEKDNGSYKEMFLVDTIFNVPELKILDIPKISISSVRTEFKNSNKR